MLSKPQVLLQPMSLPADGVSHRVYREGEHVFVRGDPADSVFHIQDGRIKKTSVSAAGKERVIAIFQSGEFVGVGCMIGRTKRMLNAIAMTTCSVVRVEKSVMLRTIVEQPALAETFISSLIARNSHYEDDLRSHLMNSGEKRLARTLLALSEVRDDEYILPKITQESLAEIVGTTRSRINHFLKKFRELGAIEYKQGIRVKRSLLHEILSADFESYDQN